MERPSKWWMGGFWWKASVCMVREQFICTVTHSVYLCLGISEWLIKVCLRVCWKRILSIKRHVAFDLSMFKERHTREASLFCNIEIASQFHEKKKLLNFFMAYRHHLFHFCLFILRHTKLQYMKSPGTSSLLCGTVFCDTLSHSTVFCDTLTHGIVFCDTLSYGIVFCGKTVSWDCLLWKTGGISSVKYCLVLFCVKHCLVVFSIKHCLVVLSSVKHCPVVLSSVKHCLHDINSLCRFMQILGWGRWLVENSKMT